jgi:hypothetical protein
MTPAFKNTILIFSLFLNVAAGKYIMDNRSMLAVQPENKLVDCIESKPSIVNTIAPIQKDIVKTEVRKKTKTNNTVSVSNASIAEVSSFSPLIADVQYVAYDQSISAATTLPTQPVEQNVLETDVVNQLPSVLPTQMIDAESKDVNEKAVAEVVKVFAASPSEQKDNSVMNNTSTADESMPAAQAEKVSLRVNLKTETDVKVVWADKDGKVMNVSNSTLDKGIQKISLDTTEISTGTYTIDIVDTSTNQTLKSVRFVKL